jgi:hypothetical protein
VLGTLLRDAAGVVDRRFFLSALLPSGLFCALVVAVGTAGQDGLADAVEAWDGTPASTKWLQIGAFVAAVGLTAGALASLRTSVLRWFEGYWTSAPGRLVASLGRAHHARRHRALSALVADGAVDAYETVSQDYPPVTQPDQVMPTRLGNVLRSAELYPHDRYAIDAVLVWPRLYHVLPERFVETFSAARSDVDVMLALSALSTVFGVGSAAYVLAVGGSSTLYLGSLWGSALVAHLTYRSALRNASTYGLQVRAAFDLYRGELRSHLGDDPPADDVAERAYWERLCLFWYRGVPRDFAAPEPADTPSRTSAASGGAAWTVLSLTTWAALAVLATGAGGALLLA